MIRNYRLHLVTKESELTSDDRLQLGLNTGTSIYVNNSIIQPELFTFTTSLIQDEGILDKLAQSSLLPLQISSLDASKSDFSDFQKKQHRKNKQPSHPITQNNNDDDDDLELEQMLSNTLRVGMEDVRVESVGTKMIKINENYEVSTSYSKRMEQKVRNPSTTMCGEDKSNELIVSKCQSLLNGWLEGLNLKEQMVGKFQVAADSALRLRKETLQQIVEPKQIKYQKRGKKSRIEQVPDNDFYNHIKMTFVDPTTITQLTNLMSETVKINLTSERLEGAFNNINYRQTERAMELMWHLYSHLDPIGLKPEDLPIELFVSYEKWVGSLSRRIQHEHKSVYAEIDHKETNGVITQRTGEIVDFDPGSLKFLIQNKETGYKTWRSRMEMRLTEDPKDGKNVKKEMERAQAIIDNTHQFMRVHELIIKEFTRLFPYISMNDQMRKNIQKRTAFKEARIRLEEFAPSLRRLMLQVEALFVFGIFKSIIVSQKSDLLIKRLLLKYQVPLDTQALTYYVPEVSNKLSFGKHLVYYSIKKAKTKLCQASLLLTNQKFMQMPVQLAKIQMETLDKVRLFQTHVEPSFLHVHGGEIFKKINSIDLEVKVNQYPLNHRYFVAAQKVVSEFFNSTLKYRWCEGIYRKILDLVKSEFDYREGTKLEEHNIDPSLKQLFLQIKINMQNVLRVTLKDSLANYLEFLLGFQLRDGEDMRQTSAYQFIQQHKLIELPSTQRFKGVTTLKEDVYNDMELVRLRRSAFVKLSVTVDTKGLSQGTATEQAAQKNAHAISFKPITKPDLPLVKKDLMSVVTLMHKALKGVDRVDKLVFPLLNLPPPTNFVNVPSLSDEEDLHAYVNAIDQLVEVANEKSRALLSWLQSYTLVFQKTLDEILMDLKKRTYVLQNEHLLDESDNDDESLSQSAAYNFQSDAQKLVYLDLQSVSSKESNKLHTRFQPRTQTNLKYQRLPEFPPGSEAILKSLEIDKDLFMDELFGLRDEYWDVQEDIEAKYDFGLFELECGPLKDKITKHIKKLIDHLESFQKKEFMAKMEQIQNEIRIITSKLEEQAESIDEVMMLLDYIEVVKRPESKVDELTQAIANLNLKMEYILDLEIMLDGDAFRGYLGLLRWPTQFREWLEERRTALLSTKENLFSQMASEKEMIYSKIKETAKRVDCVKRNEGLIRVSELDKSLWGVPQLPTMRTSVANQKQLQSRPLNQEEKESPTARRKRQLEKKGLQKSSIPKQHIMSRLAGRGDESKEDLEEPLDPTPVAYENPSDDYMVKRETALAAFLFMAKEIEWDDYRFEPDVIEEVFDMIEGLKEDYEEIERMTIQINKREMLLAIDKTDFKELRMVYDDLKPLCDLWTLANKFNQAFPVWFEGKFESLDSEAIDSNVNEWANELKRLSKSFMLQSAPRQQELLQFIQKSIGQFKFYIPMLKSLRTKGLSLRHWRMIGAKLGFSFDPATMTLWKLINMKMHEEARLAIIRSISEIATKEHALLTGIESLDKDMRTLEFTLVPYKNSATLIVLKLPEVLQSFEEFQTRFSILKSNPFMKNFFEKLHDIDRIIKLVIEMISEWLTFQRHWMYLQEIFSLQEIQKQLESHCRKFAKIDEYFKTVTKGFQLAVRVHVGMQREVAPHMIQKMIADCESIGKGLGEFLEFKREKYPRLYFLSNEEIVEIFGLDKLIGASKAKQEGSKRTFITNLFEGAEVLRFRDQDFAVTGLRSKEGEELSFVRHVPTERDPPDVWLSNLDQQMQNTLRLNILSAFATFHKETDFTEWISRWLGQSLLVAVNLWFTFRVESLLNTYRERIQYQVDKQRAELEAETNKDDLYIDQVLEDATSKKVLDPALTPRAETDPSNLDTEGRKGGALSLNSFDDQSSKESFTTFGKIQQNSNNEQSQPAAAAEGSDEEASKQAKLLLWQQRQAAKLQTITLEDYLDRKTVASITSVALTGCNEKGGVAVTLNFDQSLQEQMDDFLYEIKNILDEFTFMVRKHQTRLNRVSTINLITSMVHFREIMEKLIAEQVTESDSFTWQMQFKLRFKDLTKNLMLKQQQFEAQGKVTRTRLNYTKLDIELEAMRSQRSYSFEYLGNAQRLVITPLTERCQRSLIIALHYCYGGAPEGPVGTGKTETVKDLSRQLGKTCFMMNCSSNFEYLSAIRFFKGLAATGFWVCFDEFNRMDPHLISMLSQVIIAIQGAIKRQTPTIVIETTKINIKAESAVFITLNPNYAGRHDLPLNLKNLFRPISMVVPDTVFITKILLYSAGFLKASKLAEKLITTLDLAQKSIIRKDNTHEFGLRTIKAIVAIAERLKLQYLGITESELPYFLDDNSLAKLPYRNNPGFDPEVLMIIKFLKSRKAPLNKEIEPQNEISEADVLLKNQAMSIKDEDPLLVRGPDVKTLLELQKLNGVKRRGKLAGTKSRVFEDLIGGRENLMEIGQMMLLAQIGLEPNLDRKYEGQVIEEKMILKALKDYNQSMFTETDQIIVEGIIKDVFEPKQEQVYSLRKDADPFYGNLHACIESVFRSMKLDMNTLFLQKALLFYELMKAKHGIIILGSANSGKSTLIKLLENSINKSSQNEMQVLIDERKRLKLNEITEEEYQQIITQHHPRPISEESSRPGMGNSRTAAANTLQSNLSHMSGLTSSTQNAKRKSKRSRDGLRNRHAGPQQVTYGGEAFDLSLIEEVQKRIKLTKREIKELRTNLVLKGVVTKRVNPKSLILNELFGKYNSELRLWQEGIFTEMYREFSNDATTKRKWIVLDGGIDSAWAENLNSILDDNRKMSLPNGESIYLSQGMSLLIETDNLKSATPATISRCGLVFLESNKYVKPKYLFNHWLRTLPSNLLLDGAVQDLENYCNLLIPEAFAVIEQSRVSGNLIAPFYVDDFSLIKTFIRLLDAFLHDYRTYGEKISAKRPSHSQQKVSVPGITSQQTPSLHAGDLKQLMTLNLKDGTDSSLIQAHIDQTQGNEGAPRELQMEKKDEREILFQQSLRISVNSFLQNEMRMENAMKFQAVFLEAAVIFSIVWGFGSVLNDNGKRELDSRLKAKIEPLKTDFVSFQKWKKRQATQQEGEQNEARKAKGFQGLTESPQTQQENDPNQFELTSDFCANHQSFQPPKFISEPPTTESSPQRTFFDYYFSFDMTAWYRFSVDKELNNAVVSFHHLPSSMKKVHDFYVPTLESIKYSYLLETLIVSQQPALLIGRPQSGKSELLKHVLMNHIFKYSDRHFVEHLTFTTVTDARMLKEQLERRLVQEVGNSFNHLIFSDTFAKEENSNTMQKYLRPEQNKNMLAFIDDINMPLQGKQNWQQNPLTAIEMLRDYMTTGGWHMTKGMQFRRVFDTFIFATLTDQEQAKVSKRLTHHFANIGLDMPSRETVKSIFKVYSELIVMRWGSEIQQFAPKICEVLVEFLQKFQDTDQNEIFKRTPARAHYHFNWTDLFKVCSGLTLIEASYLRKRQHLAKLLYHEMIRVFGDQVSKTEEHDSLCDLIKDLCTRRFGLQDSIRDEEIPRELYFSFFNPDVESFYFEIESLEKASDVIEKLLERYNDQPQMQQISLVFFKELNKALMKIIRGVSTHHGCLIVVALKGSGIQSLQKLACFAQALILRPFKLDSVYAERSQWLEVFKPLMRTACQEDKGIVLSIDQSDLPLRKSNHSIPTVEDTFIGDLNCILKNNFHSEVFLGAQLEFDLMLGKVHDLIEDEVSQKAGQGGGHQQKQQASRNRDNKTQSTSNNSKKPIDTERSSVKQGGDQSATAEQTVKSVNPIQKYPWVRAEHYINMLKRIKANLRVILNLSPTGDHFKELIRTLRHSLIPQSTLIWINEAPREALMELAYKNYIELYQQEERVRFSQARDQHRQRILGEKLVSSMTLDNDYAPGLLEMSAEDSSQKVKELALARLRNASPNKILESCVQMYLDSRNMAIKFYQDHKQTVYFTPKHFLNLFRNYRRLFLERQKSVSQTKRRYESGLKKIIEAQDAIQSCHKQLELKTPQLQGRQGELVERAITIETRYAEIQSLRDQLKRDEYYLEEDLRNAESIKEECDIQLSRVMPALNEAVNSIKAIPRKDISEIKVMKKPPRVIKLIMRALCIILDIKPIVKKCKDGVTYKPSYWLAALSQDLLGNPNLTEYLIEFDRSRISTEMMQKIELDILTDPDYTFENAYHASKAAPAFFDWVRAVRDYFYVFREIEPRRDAYMLADIQCKQKLEEAQLKREEVRVAEFEVAKLREQQAELERQVDILRGELSDCKERKRRADTLMRSLATEKQKWIVCTRVLSTKFQNVAGDVILGAAYITFLSSFTKKFRQKLLNQWVDLLLKAGFHVSSSENFSLVELFGDSSKVRAWTSDYGLPNDDHSLSNAIVIEKSQQLTICVDPQLQANSWLKKLLNDAGVIVARQTESQFLKTVEYSIREGKPLLIENVGDQVAPNLIELIESWNQIKQNATSSRKDLELRFDKKIFKYLSSFALYLTTTLERPHFSIEIQNIASIVNFQITLESLHQQLLSLIIGTERKELEDRFMENSKEAFELTKSLREIENAILELLKQEPYTLLDDDVLIRTLNESRATEQQIASKLKTIEQTTLAIRKTCDAYSSAARRASLMYFVIIQLHEVTPMFRFSLNHFMKSFLKATQVAVRLGGRSLQIISSGPPGKGASAAARRAYEAALLLKQEEHMQNLLNSFISDLYRKVTAALTPDNKELFTYQLIFKVLDGEGLLDKTELFRFILGRTNKSRPNQAPPKTSLDSQMPDNQISWLTQTVWNELKRLEQFDPFSADNLTRHILTHEKDWTAFYHLLDAVSQDASTTIDYDYTTLPNAQLVNMLPFSPANVDPGPFMIASLLQKKTTRRDIEALMKKSRDGVDSQKQSVIDEEQESIRDDQDSDLVSHSKVDQSDDDSIEDPVSRNETSIINDDELWHISFSDDTNEGESSSDIDNAFEGPIEVKKKKHNQSLNDQILASEANRLRQQAIQFREEKIALYLLSASPLILYTPVENQEQKMRDEQQEYERQQRRDKVAESMTLLSVLRCLKPELLGQYIIKLLSPHANLNRILESQFLKPQKLSLKEQEEIQKQVATGYVPQLGIQQAPVLKIGTLQKTQLMKIIKDACDEANHYTPIFFVINGSVNVHQTIVEFQRSFTEYQSSCRLHYMSMGRGLEKKVEERIFNSSQSGDWLLLENLHLVLDWLPRLEDILFRLQTSTDVINQRFRLWLSSVPLPNFPEELLKLSIKVSLQPPSGVKQIMERLISNQTSESLIQAGKVKGIPKENCHVHKNLFFSLMYLHAMLEGRKRFCSLGWNIDYQFDQGDFEISSTQLSKLVLQPMPELVEVEELECINGQIVTKKSSGNDLRVKTLKQKLEADLDYVRFLVGKVNYGGKIQLSQDQRVLDSLISDLLNSDLAFNESAQIAPNMFNSHMGYPQLDMNNFGSYNDFIYRLRDQDNEVIFGFNPLIEKSLKAKQMDQILQNMLALKKRRKLFMSPLDKRVSEDLDFRALDLCRDILNQVRTPFEQFEKLINKPLSRSALENSLQLFISKEVHSYHSLLKVICTTVSLLVKSLDGEIEITEELEQLQGEVYRGDTPAKWLQFSFSTARLSLPQYLSDLLKRINFIQDIRSIIRQKSGDLSQTEIWFGGFFNQANFLQSLKQQFARKNNLPLSQISTNLEIYITSDLDENSVTLTLLKDLFIEGAQLNQSTNLIEEKTDSQELFCSFPLICVKARVNELKDSRKRKDPKVVQREMLRLMNQQKGSAGTVKAYQCPIFKNQLRLSEIQGCQSQRKEVEPIAIIELQTKEEPDKWAKRSVAIILDINQ